MTVVIGTVARVVLVIVIIVILIKVTVVKVVIVTEEKVVIVTVVAVAVVKVVIVSYFSKNNLTPSQTLRCSQGSLLRFLQFLRQKFPKRARKVTICQKNG